MVRALLLSVLLAGCSTTVVHSHVACAQIDWWEAGRTEGVAGLPYSRALSETASRCEGRPIEIEPFENGHEAGLIDYCTPSQGFALGRNGQPYEQACPEYLETAFKKAYETGLNQRALEAAEVRDSKSSATL